MATRYPLGMGMQGTDQDQANAYRDILASSEFRSKRRRELLEVLWNARLENPGTRFNQQTLGLRLSESSNVTIAANALRNLVARDTPAPRAVRHCTSGSALCVRPPHGERPRILPSRHFAEVAAVGHCSTDLSASSWMLTAFRHSSVSTTTMCSS